MTAVIGALELLREHSPEAGLSDSLLEMARGGADRVLARVNAVLDVGRLESGHLELQPVLTEAFALVDPVVRQLEPLAGRRGIALSHDTPPGLSLTADVDLVVRVLENLVGNAIKFTPQGGRVRVETTATKDEAVFRVSDDGPGIEPAMRERLFQKYATGRLPGRGTGLGLAFCRLVVEAHGGHIDLEDRAVPGTTFRFGLPLSRGDLRAD